MANWINGGIKHFSPNAPPQAWLSAYTRSLFVTALNRLAPAPTVIANRPVPRSANCHYDGVKSLSLTGGPSTFYFY